MAKRRRPRPLSSDKALSMLDQRTRQARLIRDTIKVLTEHVGGDPNPTQRMLIERLAKIRLRLELFEEKMAKGLMTPHDGRVYGGLNNAFRLLLRDLGPRAAKKTRSIQDILAGKPE